MKEIPSTGAFLRSSVHFAQISVGIFAGPRKGLGDDAFEDAVVIDHENPNHGLAVLDFLPEARGGWLGGLPRKRGGEQHARPVTIGSVGRNLDKVVRIIIT